MSESLMKGSVGDVIGGIGHTPIVRLNTVTKGLEADIYVKLEYMNPGGSMKDRVALNIIEDAEKSGALVPGGVIIEATSGNTGMGLAMIGAIRGYQCIFVMPDKMSQEKISSLRAFGARVVICPTAVEPQDPRSYYSVANRLVEETPKSFYANQYHNPSNPNAHYRSTAPEIWQQTGGEFDVFVAGMGTGGTISGCARYFKERKPEIQIVGVDPIGSLYYEYVKTGRMTKPFAYYVEGIGEDFLPSTMDLKSIDEIMRVDDRECFRMTRDLVRLEGIYAGGSSGAAVSGAIEYAKQAGKKQNILVLLPDSAQKYLSKIFDDQWMSENGFLEDENDWGTVADMLRGREHEVITVSLGTSVRETIRLLKKHDISQVPVMGKDGRLSGIVAEVDLLAHIVAGEKSLDHPIDGLVGSAYQTVTPATRVGLLKEIFSEAKVICVLDNDNVSAVVTKIDLIDFLATRP